MKGKVMCNKCLFIKDVIEAAKEHDIESIELPMVLMDMIQAGSNNEIRGMLIELKTGSIAMAENALLEPDTAAMIIADLTARSNEYSKGEADSHPSNVTPITGLIH